MSKRSAPSTPSRSSARETRKTPRFQVDNNTPRSSSHARTPMRASANFKKIIGHRIYDGFYVEYDVELNDGTTMEVTASDFKKCPQLLKDYQKEVTGQEEDSREEYVVEKILTHRMINGKPLFLIQWEGFPHPVWHSELSEDELGNCEGVMREYRLECNKVPRNPRPQVAPTEEDKSAKKRAAPSHDKKEIEVFDSTPRKIAKKRLIGSARHSRTRNAVVVESSEEQQDEDDIPEERSFDHETQDHDDDEEEDEDIEQAKNEKKKGGMGWLFNPFKWF